MAAKKTPGMEVMLMDPNLYDIMNERKNPKFEEEKKLEMKLDTHDVRVNMVVGTK